MMSAITRSAINAANTAAIAADIERMGMMVCRVKKNHYQLFWEKCDKCFGWYDPAVGCKCEIAHELRSR
jgi:hypothetical protein